MPEFLFPSVTKGFRITFFILLYASLGYSQTDSPMSCGFKEITTSIVYEQDYLEAMLRLNKNNGAQKNNAVYTIPVVIHIIHDGDAIGTEDNPTKSALNSILNEASQRFRHAHAGADTYPDNPSYGVDTEIEFCLATTDSDGNFSTGIVRHYAPENTIGTYNELCAALDQYRWDTNKYCNLFIVNNITDAAGVSCGNKTIYDSNAFWSGLIAHELGHYFSLGHTFGSNNGCPTNTNCLTDGDRVCDTPPKGLAGAQGGSCNSPNNSCTTDEADASVNNPYRSVGQGGLGDQVDMLANYMDYTASCWDAFTQGQKDRMRFNIENNRSALINNAAVSCAPQSQPANEIAIIEVLPNNSPCSESFSPSFEIVNNGSTTVTSLVLKAYLDNSIQQTEAWAGNLAPDARTTITFGTPLTNTPGEQVLKLIAEEPNGNIDASPNDNEGFANVYYGGTGSAIPFGENFTACQTSNGSINSGWQFSSSSSSSSCQGCTASVLAFSEDPVQNTLSLPLIDLTGIDNPKLEFKMGHIPRYDFVPNDQLKVEVSTNCNAATTVFQKSGLDKATNEPAAYSNGDYVVPACDQFKTESIDLSSFKGMNQVQITFVALGEWWSPLLIDDISIVDAGPLPVELSSFTATKQGKVVALNWTTDLEENNQGFSIERKTVLNDWETIGFVEGNGTSRTALNYSFLDIAPEVGDNYYRLKQIDFDGVFEYSMVRVVTFSNVEADLLVYPNPTSDIVNIQLNEIFKKGDLELYDQLGRLVYRDIITSPSEQLKTISVKHLPEGVYIISIDSNDQHFFKRFVLQRSN